MFNVLLKVARCLPLPQTCINGTRAAGLEPRGFIGVPTPARSVPRPGVPREAIGQRWQGPACAGAVDGLLGTRRTTSSPGTRSQPQRTPSKPPAFNASPRPSPRGARGVFAFMGAKIPSETCCPFTSGVSRHLSPERRDEITARQCP